MKMPIPAKRQSILQWETLEPRILLSAGTEALLVDNSIFEQDSDINHTETVLVLNQNNSNAEQQDNIENTIELVIIDASTPNYELLLDDLRNQNNKPLEVLVLDNNKDGIEQINSFLNQYDDVSALHFISHGSDGNINLGSSNLNVNTLSDYSDDLQSWQDQLTEDADILIYGCDVADTDAGKEFVDILSVLTGADVAASDDLTGHESKGADWDLEYQRGSIEAGLAISLDAQKNWNEVLAAPIGSVNITGVPAIGQTLTATNDLADADGLGVFQYSWYRNGVLSPTSSDDPSYLLTSDDSGVFISVNISYTDGAMNSESVASSNSLGINTIGHTGSVIISGEAVVGQTLEMSNTIIDPNGFSFIPIDYYWVRHGENATDPIEKFVGTTYELTDDDAGRQISAYMFYFDGVFDNEYEHSVKTTTITHAPTAVNSTVISNEDEIHTFIAADFNFTDVDDDTFTKIKITTLESKGSLQFNDNGTTKDVTLGQEIDVTDIVAGKLTFMPLVNDNGTTYDSFTFKVHDGFVYSDLAYSMTIDVSAVNDAPTAVNNTVTTNEDTTYTFTTADFGFTDIDVGDSLTQIQITKLEGLGPLQFEGNNVAKNQVITVADITAGKLKFVPVANGNGNGHDSFEFKVHDGTDYSVADYVITIDINAVNDAPTGSVTISGTVTEDQTLTAENTLADADGLGALTYQWLRNGISISNAINNTYTLTDADVGALMTVTVKYNDGYGTQESVTSAATAAVANINDAPIAFADNLTTNEDSSLLINPLTDLLINDTDIDGDVLSIATLSQPSNGSIVDNGHGTYTYIPTSNFNGSDSFTVTISDGNGGTDTATVTITVNSINDAPLTSDQAFEINSLANNQTVGSFIANDPDLDDTLTYSIINGSGNTGFSIDPVSGQIFISNINLIDPSQTSQTFVVQIKDGSGANNSAQVTITLKFSTDEPKSPERDKSENSKSNDDKSDDSNKRSKHNLDDIFHHGRSDHYFTSSNYFKKHIEHDDVKEHKRKSIHTDKEKHKLEKNPIRTVDDIFKKIKEMEFTQNQEYLSLIQLEEDKHEHKDNDKKKQKTFLDDKQDTVVASVQKVGTSVLVGVAAWAFRGASKNALTKLKNRSFH